MRRFSTLLAVFIIYFSGLLASAQGLSKGVSFLVKGAPQGLAKVEVDVARNVFRAAQNQLPALKNLQSSIVQISIPRYKEKQLQPSLQANASGFLLAAYGKVWVASAYHVMGTVGSERVVRLRGNDNEMHEVLVQVNMSGRAGWHEPDIALAQIRPEDIPAGMKPLSVGELDLNRPAYSVGYVSGQYTLDDFLPVKREILFQEGVHMLSTYHIPGSSTEVPITGNGQCGAPIVQQIPGTNEWAAIGIHNGHCLDWENNELGRGSGVNLSLVLPDLKKIYLEHQAQQTTRPLVFQGQEIGSLDYTERVDKVILRRNGRIIFQQELKMFAEPYLDSRAEDALAGQELVAGDEVEFEILRQRTERQPRLLRNIKITIP